MRHLRSVCFALIFPLGLAACADEPEPAAGKLVGLAGAVETGGPAGQGRAAQGSDARVEARGDAGRRDRAEAGPESPAADPGEGGAGAVAGEGSAGAVAGELDLRCGRD